MSVGQGDHAENIPALHEVYIVELREHAVALVWMGYERMKSKDFAVAEEDEITGELARHMDEVTQAEDAPLWAEHYTVREQVRSHTAGKLGKRRPIVDVEFERHKRGKRPRLRFEAKRLGRGAGVSDYIGTEGLGSFLDGHYSRTHDEAGMLGYIQDETEQAWAAKLSSALTFGSCRVVTGGHWVRMETLGPAKDTYRTVHEDMEGKHVLVLHLLLSFTE